MGKSRAKTKQKIRAAQRGVEPGEISVGNPKKITRDGIERAEVPPEFAHGRREGFVEEVIAKTGTTDQTRYRRLDTHPLVLAYEAGRIDEVQFNAGHKYRLAAEAMARTGHSSLERLGVSGGRGGDLAPALLDTMSWMTRVHIFLSDDDREVIRKVCGEGWQPSEAIAAQDPELKRSVTLLFQRALRALAGAINRAERIARKAA